MALLESAILLQPLAVLFFWAFFFFFLEDSQVSAPKQNEGDKIKRRPNESAA